MRVEVDGPAPVAVTEVDTGHREETVNARSFGSERSVETVQSSIPRKDWLALLNLGFVHIRDFFDQALCDLALDEAQSLNTTVSPPVVGSVQQQLRSSRLSPSCSPTALRSIACLIANALSSELETVVGLDARLWPNEITIAHYDYEGGISAHRDHNCYRWVVAIMSVKGAGLMRIVEDRTSTRIIDEFVVGSGDLVLLGAADLAPRPFHTISTLSDERTSISFRYDASSTASNNL